MRSGAAFGSVVAAVAGRLVLLALVAMTLVAGVEAVADPGLNLLALPFAAVFLGVLLATFTPVQTAGLVLAAAGFWVVLVGYGTVAFLDPFSVVTDTDGSSRVEVETAGGARVLGAFFLLAAIVPLVVWVVGSARERRRARQRRAAAESPEHQALVREWAVDEEERRRQRARAKRWRKKRRR